MEYVSTRNSKVKFSFKDVFLNGLAADGGLYVPCKTPHYSREDIKKLKKLSYQELAVKIVSDFCNKDFSVSEIEKLVSKSYKNFRTNEVIKIQKVGNLHFLELHHGPTLAFKDIAMQLIGNMYELVLEKNKININIIVATSGDTGAAAINAIKDKKNMKVFVFHPENKISEIQRKFMTTVKSKNVYNIALAGTFDDCQKIVKEMFLDENFKSSANLSGVNSINWARIIAQIVYYFFSFLKEWDEKEKINFSVPTGNFGDIFAGFFAKKMGLPINKLLIATNTNNILQRVLESGLYKPSKVHQTLSPSMDIQVASNFERLLFYIFDQNEKKLNQLMSDLKNKGSFNLDPIDLEKIKKDFIAQSVSDDEVLKIIKNFYEKFNILIDPHTAVGVGAIEKENIKGKNIVLSTADPSKFRDAVKKATKQIPNLPKNLNYIVTESEKYEQLPINLEKIKKYILSKI